MPRFASRRAPADLRADLLGERMDMREMVRPAVWGCAAIVAMLLTAFAAQTKVGQSRIASAFGTVTGTEVAAAHPDRGIGQTVAQIGAHEERAPSIDTRQVTEALRHLSEDRDQLLARIAMLERNYEEAVTTGSIGQQTSAPASHTASAEQLFPLSPSPDIAPVIAPPPQPSAPVATIAATRMHRDQPATETVPVSPSGTEFGIDLGGAPTMAALRIVWHQIRRDHGSLIEGLRPVIGVRDNGRGQIELRLVVGPLSNAAEAGKICAALFAVSGPACQPAPFEGQRLAMRQP